MSYRPERHRWILLLPLFTLLLIFFSQTAPAFSACPIIFPYTVAAGDTPDLINAITCANTNGAGTNDVINLTNSTYTLTAEHSSQTGLPPIAAGNGTLTINGDGAMIERSSAVGTPQFRLLNVSAGGSLVLNRVTLRNGRVSGVDGGAILNAGTLTVTNSTIRNSRGANGGGLRNNSGATMTLNGVAVTSNSADTAGGGISNAGVTLRIINSTLSGNAANGAVVNDGGGGGLDTYSGSVQMTNSTITNNTAVHTVTSGIWQSSTLTIQNSIVAFNNGANNCAKDGGTFTDNGNNLDNGTSCGFGGSVGQNTNPMLGALADNGGYSQTHALLPGSPAINAGDNAKAVDQSGAALVSDQRGAISTLDYARFIGTTVDIGAYEFLYCPSFPHTVPASDTIDLLVSISCANATAGNETINLASASTYTLTSVSSNESGLPPILGGSGTLTINGNGATIARSSAGGTPSFRLLYVLAGGDVTLNQITLTNGYGVDFGGGIFNKGTLTLIDSAVTNNRAYLLGGGIDSLTATLTLMNSTVSGNRANDSGGGIFGISSTLSIINSTVSGNATGYDGGGIGINFGTATLMNSTISGNDAYDGGGLHNNSATARIINSTVSGNTADNYGGGIFSNASTLAINSTIANNNSRGIYLNGGTTTFQNSIVANNNGANNCTKNFGTFIDNGNNIDNGTTCGFGGTVGQNTNPMLGALANNGGSTQTHALLPGSPAINAGSNAKAVDHNGAALTTDQRGAGFPRINNTTVDIGAFETDLRMLTVNLSLQGRVNPMPHPSYVVTVHVKIMPQGGGAAFYNQSFVSNTSGVFNVSNLPIGTYLFSFKGTHTLARQVVLTIAAGSNSTTTSLLLEGDANDNNVVNISDFSILAAAFGSTLGGGTYDARADFNGDTDVNIGDFSLLAANFGQTGAGGVTP